MASYRHGGPLINVSVLETFSAKLSGYLGPTCRECNERVCNIINELSFGGFIFGGGGGGGGVAPHVCSEYVRALFHFILFIFWRGRGGGSAHVCSEHVMRISLPVLFRFSP